MSQNRAVLIGTQSIQVSRTVATKLRHSGLQPRVLNGVQDADEAAVISAAGRPGAVTVATNLAGRGTDIRLYGVTAAAGGLHVIVAGCHPLARVDRQLIGRAARGGDPGSARFFIAADDDLIRGHAGWLQRVIARELAEGTYATLPLSDHIVPPSSTRRHLMDVQESLHRVQTGQRRDRWLQSHRDARWQQDPVDRSIHVNLCGVS